MWKCTCCDEIYEDGQECAAFESQRRADYEQRISDLEDAVENAERERDEARSEATRLQDAINEHQKGCRFDQGWAKAERAVEKAERERDEARRLVREMRPWWPGDQILRLPDWAK